MIIIYNVIIIIIIKDGLLNLSNSQIPSTSRYSNGSKFVGNY